MASNDGEVTVSVPVAGLVALCLAGGLVGLVGAFAIGPVTDALVDLVGDAPGWLKAVANFPLAVALPVLILAGLAAGGFIANEWYKENGTIKVNAHAVTILRENANSRIRKDRVGAVFTDGGELVLADTHTNELLRLKVDAALHGRLSKAFQLLGYPWRGKEDPHESGFMLWLDGGEELERDAHELLRTRQRALAEKRLGAAAQAREDLAAIGVTVRDRRGGQQYRLVLPRPAGRSQGRATPL